MDQHVIGIALGPGLGLGLGLASLTDAMVLPPGGSLPGGSLPRDRLVKLVQPVVVPEIVFVMSSALAGPGVTAATALAAVGSVYGALTVIDDGAPRLFMMGPVGVAPDSVDLSLEACLLEVNGQVVDSATGAAVQGHPAQALTRAANDRAADSCVFGNRAIEPGWIVLTGAMTEPVPLAGIVAAHFTHLGSVFLAYPLPQPAPNPSPHPRLVMHYATHVTRYDQKPVRNVAFVQRYCVTCGSGRVTCGHLAAAPPALQTRANPVVVTSMAS
ncbi:MAG TPA: hypothetical protein VF070_20915 [Streptosporangiaceae bacterium]